MPQTITIQPNQSLYDIAVQTTGNYDNTQAIANANGLCTTDLLTPGSMLAIPDGLLLNPKILRYYNSNGRTIIPATGDIRIAGAERLDGLDYWELETEFEVS